jgi:hypothetical protein
MTSDSFDFIATGDDAKGEWIPIESMSPPIFRPTDGKASGADDFKDGAEDEAALLLPAVQAAREAARRTSCGDDEAEDSIVIDYGALDF